MFINNLPRLYTLLYQARGPGTYKAKGNFGKYLKIGMKSFNYIFSSKFCFFNIYLKPLRKLSTVAFRSRIV